MTLSFKLMNTYIFYTNEGHTTAPNDEELENLQVLGIEKGFTKEEALSNLFTNNEWIKTTGFSESGIKCYAISKQ